MQIEKLYPPMGTDSYPNRNEISSFSKSFANNFKPSKLNIRTAWAAQNVNGVKENNAVLPYSSRNKEIDVEQESKWWKKINVCKSLAVHIEEYFIHSSLHGLRYIGDKTISLGERSEVEQMLLDDYCNSNNSFSNITTVSDEGTKWDNVLKFILRVNPSCQEILKVCLWRQEEMPCEDLFNSALTDDGLCCTFNALPGSFIFKNAREMAGLNLTFPPQVDDWNPENGYSENSSINALPWRASGAGTHLGLTIVLDAQLDAYYCSSSVGVGFKMLLHNPLETPKMADFALLLAAGLEARVIVRPKIYDATQSIRSINIQKRICYFTNERDLQFYRTYTELNCKLECQANYTLSLCGCVPFYLPSTLLLY
ncbi:hypothetical protein FQA39_LY08120 [Lamprigera yunnana]|nr:hypothetical protein FQA39_LY08120 [Lamprigera yunnana]